MEKNPGKVTLGARRLSVFSRPLSALFTEAANIYANPVKDGLVERLEEWPWSNYLEWVGLREGKLVDRQFVAEMFPDTAVYEEFVRDYLIERKLPEELNYLRDFK
ncbi:MAG TPA: hypothetical protein ENK32_05710 [Anaerolineae bacterium]|nr:hypothetical protein [Anaerolineae bacterium]